VVISVYQPVSEKWRNLFKNIWDVFLHVKNKACTFALPIGNNGIADGETTSSEKHQSKVL
jgi:hypothetical protein